MLSSVNSGGPQRLSHLSERKPSDRRPSRDGGPGAEDNDGPSAPGHRHILLVEDDRAIGEVVGGILRDEGYRVTLAENGREALDRLRDGFRPDLIVLDLRMPVMDGWEFRAAQKKDPVLANIPVLAISADGSAQAEAIAAQGYLRKPVSTSMLLDTVGRVLRESERHQQRGRTEEVERFAALGRLAAGVGHEINNPLMFASMNVDLALQELQRIIADGGSPPLLDDGPPRQQLPEIYEILAESRIGLCRIRDVVKNLQGLSRAPQAKQELFSVHEVLNESLVLARNHLEHRATVLKSYGPVPPMTGDRSAIGQVFLNLLLNAAQALPAGHADANEIGVSTTSKGNELTVEIRDTGAGIPDDALPHIFDPFYTTKPIGEGTGLGLAVSHRIVTDHGGRIAVDSMVGRGSTVRVTLPLGIRRPDLVGVDTVSRRTAVFARRARVLVIDDEPLVARAIEAALSDEHEVIAVVRAADAFARLAAGQTFDVILCDLLMPSIEGSEFYGRLLTDWPALARNLVFMTGGAFVPETREFLERTSQRVLSKPFTVEDLRAVIYAQMNDAADLAN